MSDTAGSGEVVRGAGNAPGQSPGEAMPTVTTKQRASLADFASVMREKNEQAERGVQPAQQQARGGQQQPQQPTRRSHIADFSAQVEARQEAPSDPMAPREQQQQRRQPQPGDQDGPRRVEDNMGDPNQVKDRGPTVDLDPNADPDQQGNGELLDQDPNAEGPLDDLSALAKFREWEQSDMFPEELAGKWLHEVKTNGQVRYVPTSELQQGYIRGVDYRRFHGEAQQLTAQAQQTQQSIQQHFEQIRDPNQMLEIFERNGYGDTLEKVAYMIAERVQEERVSIRAAMQAAKQRYRTDDDNHIEVQRAGERVQNALKRARAVEANERRLQFELQQLESTKQQAVSSQRQQEFAKQYEQQLNALRPNAMKAYGIRDTPGNRLAVARHLGNVIASTGFTGNITRDLVMQAAADLKDEMEDVRSTERGADQQSQTLSPQQWQDQRRAQNGQFQRGKPLPPNRIAAGGGKPMGVTNGKARGNLSDLEAMIRRSRSGE